MVTRGHEGILGAELRQKKVESSGRFSGNIAKSQSS